jgi:hypothetical protein
MYRDAGTVKGSKMKIHVSLSHSINEAVTSASVHRAAEAGMKAYAADLVIWGCPK